MRETNTIAKEIVKLSAIKSAYNHFLASHEGQLDVENTTYICNNKKILCGNLKKLYLELEEAKGKSDKAKASNEVADSRLQIADDRLQITEETINKTQISNDKLQTKENPQPHTLRMKFERYHATELEERALMLFNSDRRYSIRE